MFESTGLAANVDAALQVMAIAVKNANGRTVIVPPLAAGIG
jgi:hypothetical protein